MSEKKGIFGFFKGWSSITDEEQQQRSYANEQQGKSCSGNQENYKAEVNGNSITEIEDIVTEEIEDFVIEKCEEILRLATFSGKVKLKQKFGYTLQLEIFDAGDDLGRIIGKNGSCLESIQLLLKFFVIRKFETSIKVVLDAGDYRSKRNLYLKRIAFKAANHVVKSGEKEVLEPMNAGDRRWVHMLLEKNKRVSTVSEGFGSDRHIAIIRKDVTGQ